MRFLLLALLLAVRFQPFDPAQGGDRKPNILIILADDMGWGDVRSHGNAAIDTPALDRLAAEGARFDRFYVSPLCAPTRASLLTGRYSLRTGVYGVTRGWETMRGEEVTLAEILKGAGYATGCFGKWHNGSHFPNHPNRQGFDEFLGFSAGHWNLYFDSTLDRNGVPAPTKGYITDVLTDAALGFMRERKDRPFLCYVPYNAPHSPFQVPDRFYDKHRGRGLDPAAASVYGMVENIDENVGRLLQGLDDLGLARDTIVVFLTDNGPNTERFNGGMKGRKGSVHEGGIRVPCFVRHPGRIAPGQTISQIAAHIDLLPTLLEVCGVPMPDGLRIDGRSLAPLLRGKPEGWPERMLFAHQQGKGVVEAAPGSVRTPRHRLVVNPKGMELYDLVADPSQKTDLAGREPDLVRTLRGAYDEWYRDVFRAPAAVPPIPVGHEGERSVELPAHEAALSGKLRYKGGSGWAHDTIVGWERTEDAVSWDVDVVRGGRYEVTLRYGCSPKDAGARLRIEAGGASVEATLDRAHEPPVVAAQDRVPRNEAAERIWGEWLAGTLELPKGRTRLVVRALTRPGAAVMELKGATLTSKTP